MSTKNLSPLVIPRTVNEAKQANARHLFLPNLEQRCLRRCSRVLQVLHRLPRVWPPMHRLRRVCLTLISKVSSPRPPAPPPMPYPPSPEALPAPPLGNNCRRRRWLAGGGQLQGVRRSASAAAPPGAAEEVTQGNLKLDYHLFFLNWVLLPLHTRPPVATTHTQEL